MSKMIEFFVQPLEFIDDDHLLKKKRIEIKKKAIQTQPTELDYEVLVPTAEGIDPEKVERFKDRLLSEGWAKYDYPIVAHHMGKYYLFDHHRIVAQMAAGLEKASVKLVEVKDHKSVRVARRYHSHHGYQSRNAR